MPSTPSKARRAKIHRWIGQCITEWADIEETVFDICCIALATDTQLAAVVFYRTPTLDSRITLTAELLSSCFPKTPGAHEHPLMKEWLSIRARMSELIPYRNLMAHHPIDETGEQDYEIKELPGGEFDLIPIRIKSHFKIATSKSESLRRRPQAIKSIFEADMPAHYKKIAAVHTDLKSFRTALQRETLTRPRGQKD